LALVALGGEINQYHAIRWSEPLHASRDCRGLAQGQQLLSRLVPKGAHNDRTSVHADTHRNTHPMSLSEPAIEVVESDDNAAM
jgi:hypothetical protein